MSRSSYIIRNMTREESRDFGTGLERAHDEGRSMRWILFRLIRLYTQVGLEPLERAASNGHGEDQ
jgi:hypothetical protein